MRHQVQERKLGRHSAHRWAMFRNLATSLVLHERIETTLPKAKELRRVADHLITLAKEGSLHSRRQAAAVLRDPEATKKLFDGLGGRFKDRPGGYTRIFQFGFRRGDGADMAAIEYLGYQPVVKEAPKKGSKESPKKDEKKRKIEVKREEKKTQKVEKKKEEKKKWSVFRNWGNLGNRGGRGNKGP